MTFIAQTFFCEIGVYGSVEFTLQHAIMLSQLSVVESSFWHLPICYTGLGVHSIPFGVWTYE